MVNEERGGTIPGRFIVLDGVDGCGKSTQARELAEHWREQGRVVDHLREPGSTGAGERIRALLLERGVELGAGTEALLFTAARRQLLEELVRPALAAGRDVVCERFHASTFAYQAHAGELDEDELMGLLETWAGDPRPDRTVILDLEVEDAADRRGADEDRIEAKGVDFQRRVAQGYRRFAEKMPRVGVVSARGTIAEVAARVREEVERAGL